MTTKKFKRVIPGQLEKLKEMFDGYEFLGSESCATTYAASYATSYAITSEQREGQKVRFSTNNNGEADSISVCCFFELKNGLSVGVFFDVVSNLSNHELLDIFFYINELDVYESQYNRYACESKRVLREKLSYIIPIHETVYDCMDHLDYECIEYLKELVYRHINTHDMAMNAVADAIIIGVTFKNMSFTDSELKETDKLIKVNKVLSL